LDRALTVIAAACIRLDIRWQRGRPHGHKPVVAGVRVFLAAEVPPTLARSARHRGVLMSDPTTDHATSAESIAKAILDVVEIFGAGGGPANGWIRLGVRVAQADTPLGLVTDVALNFVPEPADVGFVNLNTSPVTAFLHAELSQFDMLWSLLRSDMQRRVQLTGSPGNPIKISRWELTAS
jgi:hypothetical protein